MNVLTSGDNRRAPVLQLMDEVGRMVDELGGENPGDRPRHDTEILALFDRCRSLHASIRILLEQGFVHEAIILGRPLFTDSLALAEFADGSDHDRGSLAVGWILDSIQSLERYYVVSRASGADVWSELTKIGDQRREVQEYAARCGYRTRHWRPDEQVKELAEKHGRAPEYGAHLITHMFVHGATTVTSERYVLDDDGNVRISGVRPNRALERDAGLFAVNSMLHATRAACTAFNWPEPKRLTTLWQELKNQITTPG